MKAIINMLKQSIGLKFILFFIWLFITLANWAEYFENKRLREHPLPTNKWIPRSQIHDFDRTSGYNNRYNNRNTRHQTKIKCKTYGWEEARKEEAEEWLDFLEELDNRGYDLYDPEAEDIWTEFN